jgi:hypothetical protein
MIPHGIYCELFDTNQNKTSIEENKNRKGKEVPLRTGPVMRPAAVLSSWGDLVTSAVLASVTTDAFPTAGSCPLVIP